MVLNDNFVQIERARGEIYSLIADINDKCDKLENVYKEYIKQVNKDSIVSLDTLLFQINLIKKDMNSACELFNTFIYQVYGQYYKFHKKIIQYIDSLENTNLFSGLDYRREFTPYDDIKFSVYSFDEIKAIHYVVVSIITRISQFTTRQMHEIEDDMYKIDKGLCIDTLVFEKKRSNDNMINENKMFIKVIYKFNEHQRKTIDKILHKFEIIHSQIVSEIEFEKIDNKPQEDEHLLHTGEKEESTQEYTQEYISISYIYKLLRKIKNFIIGLFEDDHLRKF